LTRHISLTPNAGAIIQLTRWPRAATLRCLVDVSESRAQGGTGLGLALVKHILNRHGGRLTIESVPGQGATFTAHLPMAEAEARGAA